MKKLFLLSLISSAILSISAYAQPSPPAQSSQPAVDQSAMLKQMKEMFKAPMMEKTGLTAAQVDRVLEINVEFRSEAATALQGLNDADRSKKLAEMKAEKERKYAAIPLSPEQIKSVYAFYEDRAKNPPQKRN